MKKVLYIATTANCRNRLDGETVKCRLLKEYLEAINEIEVISIDTDNWKKHRLKLVFQIIINYLKCDKIVVSSADRGAHIVLDFFHKIGCKKEIYYFVIGGSLYENITHQKWNVSAYQKIQKIYVEAQELKSNLELLGLKNIEQLNNFRKVEPFHNHYMETEEVKFVFYGRVIKEKGIEQAIRLIKRFHQENIACTLDIYGQCDPSYLEILKPQFCDFIRYHGEIQPNHQVEYEILSKYDIFLFPTEYSGECLPGALIDAYIAGLAVIASNWKYAKEYILENENGIVFEYKNYEDMYQKAKALIKSHNISKLKHKSLELAKQYTMDELLVDFRKRIME